MILAYIFIGLLGLSLGSFMSVIVFRLDRKEGILTGRSECPKCHKQLAWYDLVPVLSYLILRGKCRYCGSKISIIYPMVELTTAVIMVSYFWVNGFNLGLSGVYYSALIFMLAALIFFDILYLILPDKIVFSLAGLSLLYDIFFRSTELISLLVSGFLFTLAFAIIYIVYNGKAMGFGDVKLALAIGFILGYPMGFFAVVLAIWSAALWGIGMMVLKKATLKTALPFGSFLSATTIFFIIFEKVIHEKIFFYNYFF